MRTVPAAFAFAAAILASSSAFALEQAKHRAISRDACSAVGLPEDFCERVGVEAYDVDAYEWNDLSAHAQVDVELGQTACEAANLAADRVHGLAQDLRDGLFARARGEAWADGSFLATQLGRALHTVQDDCAHEGLINPHHAWLSLSDSCSGTSVSPDVQPEALACARRESAAVLAAFRATVDEAGIDPGSLDDDTARGWTHWPARGDVCAFLAGANDWDGNDTRWNAAVVVPALRAQFTAGVGGWAATGDVCGGDPDALAPRAIAAAVDTSRGQSRCLKIKLYCLGKADAADEAPPWVDPADEAAAAVPAPTSGGCATAGGDASAVGLVLIGLALGAMRRRARR